MAMAAAQISLRFRVNYTYHNAIIVQVVLCEGLYEEWCEPYHRCHQHPLTLSMCVLPPQVPIATTMGVVFENIAGQLNEPRSSLRFIWCVEK